MPFHSRCHSSGHCHSSRRCHSSGYRHSFARRHSTWLALGLLLAAPLAQPQPTTGMLADIAPCIDISGDAARLACFDRLGAAARAAQPAPVSPPADGAAVTAAAPASAAASAAVPAPAPSEARAEVAAEVPVEMPAADAAAAQVQAFGRSDPATAARVQNNADGEAELFDEIVELRERVPGRYLFTLASGQVWYQDNSQRMRLRKGMRVRIYPSPLGGSWRMARADGEQSGFVQVTRVE